MKYKRPSVFMRMREAVERAKRRLYLKKVYKRYMKERR